MHNIRGYVKRKHKETKERTYVHMFVQYLPGLYTMLVGKHLMRTVTLPASSARGAPSSSLLLEDMALCP